jgi:hypothetical protein
MQEVATKQPEIEVSKEVLPLQEDDPSIPGVEKR